MADLIDRQALLEKKREMELCFAVTEWDINDAPAVDAVEVVRCKDCAYRHSSEFCECRPPDGFCNDGERRGDA